MGAGTRAPHKVWQYNLGDGNRVECREFGRFGKPCGSTAFARWVALRECVCTGPGSQFEILYGAARISRGIRCKAAIGRAMGGGSAAGRISGAGFGEAESEIPGSEANWTSDADRVFDG